jgi:hypothetical protein
MVQKLRFALVLLVASLSMPSARAALVTMSFSGNFALDNDVVRFRVAIPITEILSVYTTSAATGGFAPYLALFDDTGAMIAQFNGGEPTCTGGFSSPRPGVGCNDTFLQTVLGPAEYFVALAQTDNFATGGFFDPFTYDGSGGANYTNDGAPCGSGTVLFCDAAAGYTPDTAAWTVSFDADVEDVAVLPEPSAFLTCFGGLALAALIGRRKIRTAFCLAALPLGAWAQTITVSQDASVDSSATNFGSLATINVGGANQAGWCSSIFRSCPVEARGTISPRRLWCCS